MILRDIQFTHNLKENAKEVNKELWNNIWYFEQVFIYLLPKNTSIGDVKKINIRLGGSNKGKCFTICDGFLELDYKDFDMMTFLKLDHINQHIIICDVLKTSLEYICKELDQSFSVFADILTKIREIQLPFEIEISKLSKTSKNKVWKARVVELVYKGYSCFQLEVIKNQMHWLTEELLKSNNPFEIYNSIHKLKLEEDKVIILNSRGENFYTKSIGDQ